MGFRNRLRSATAVDTGQPAGAGVRVYQQPTALSTRGVVEFRDGIAGDVASTLTATANLVPQGGGGYTAQGGGFVMDAGSWNGVDGGLLELLVASAAAGGYESVARLTSTRLELVVAGVTLTMGDTGWQNLPFGPGWSGGVMKYRVLNGVCYFTINSLHGAWSAGQVVTTFPVGARPGLVISDNGGYVSTPVPYNVSPSGVMDLPFSQSAGGLVALGSFPVS